MQSNECEDRDNMELHELNMMRTSEVCRRQEISFDPDKYHEEPLPSVSGSGEAGREHGDFNRHGNTQPNVEEKKCIKTRAVIDRKLSLPRNERLASGRKIEETLSHCDFEVDELEELYETRKTEAFPTAVGSMQNAPPHPTDVSCPPKDPLYVRRVGLRFWSTKRILDWQRQALRAVEDTEAVLKPVREYGEESASKDTGITVFQSHDVADLDECPPAVEKRGCTQQDQADNVDYEYNKERSHYENNDKQEHYENNEESNHRENNKELGHYGNDTNHRHYEKNKEHGHEENNAEHKYYRYDKNHSHYDEEYGHYANDKDHYANDKEHGHYENNKEHGHYDNDKEHGHYKNDREHGHYENDEEHGHYENDEEHGQHENNREHGHYENEREHGHYENDREHGHYENSREHKYFQYDKDHAHYENDEQSNLSTNVYADLDPDFLALQVAMQNVSTQPFYEMDISPVDEEQDHPFYKMDVTAAKELEMQEQQEPFYEMDIATADEKQDPQPFYNMDDNPTNVYADLDPEFVAAEDEACRRHRTKEPEENQENAHQDGPSCSQPCRVVLRSRPACITAVCVGVVIALIAATVLTLMFNHHSVMSSQPEDSTMVNQTTLSANLTTWSPPLPVMSLATSSSQIPVTSLPASPETTLGKDWQTEWILFIRGYFQQDNQTALALEERYPDNDVVLSLLADKYFWPWVCQFWNHFWELPCTLTRLVTYCIDFGTKSDYNYMESHAISTYNEFFSTVLDALEALSNITKSTNGAAEYISLSLTRRPFSNNDVEALVKLFPYLEGTNDLHLSSCGISSGAATILSKRLHFLANLKVLNLQNNNIGDDGVKAIAETFTELKNLRTLNFAGNSITTEGGKAMAENLVHLQELRTIYFRNNEVALSLHPLAKAFVNMSMLELVYMWPVTYRRGSFDMVAEQVRNAVHTLGGKVYSSTKSLLYDGSHAIRVGTAWQRVKRELNVGVHIHVSRGQLKVSVKIRPI